MIRTLRWTSESRKTFNQNLEYLAEEWDNRVINNFLDRVEEVLDQIKSNPELYPLQAGNKTIKNMGSVLRDVWRGGSPTSVMN